uniref:Uncharacterized protein n=1 Tax=Cucumis melo TaxID=3656 RepID=A0A9I9EJY3_CUCME
MEASSMTRRARPGAKACYGEGMYGAISTTQMGDRDGDGWVRGNGTTTVEASRTNTSWSRHSPLASDPDVAMPRRWCDFKEDESGGSCS